MNIEIINGFLDRIIFIHGDDVLKPEFFRYISANFQGTDNLTTIHTVEEVAIVNKEAGTDAALGAEVHEHYIEAEYLHVLDAFAARTLHRKLKLGTI